MKYLLFIYYYVELDFNLVCENKKLKDGRFEPAKVLKSLEESRSRMDSKGMWERNGLAPRGIWELTNVAKRPRVKHSSTRGERWGMEKDTHNHLVDRPRRKKNKYRSLR